MGGGTDPVAGGSTISLPKGGGAIAGMGETFGADIFTGTGNFSVPLAVPPGRGGLQPELALAYSTGHGNGLFGLGWALGLPGVSRKTARGVPRFGDDDTYLLSGMEDLVPVSGAYPGRKRYRPRTEGAFDRIEHVRDDTGDYWEVRDPSGGLTRYGTTIVHPGYGEPFAWLVTESADAVGNRIRYTYSRDRGEQDGHAWDQPVLERIEYADYGDPAAPSFLVSVEFEYESRPDPFSDYRAGFEIRTTLRCRVMRIFTHAADGVDRVVSEVRFGYRQAEFNGVSLLESVTAVGIDDQDGVRREEVLPPLTFGYSGFDPTARRFAPVTGRGLPPGPLPESLTMVDLRGTGLPDLVELGTSRRYWRNRGGGRFDVPRPFTEAPPYTLDQPGVALLDADGDGRADLVVTSTALAGYYPLTFAGQWSQRSFQPYRQVPSAGVTGGAVTLVDLDGDGLTDVLSTGSRPVCWFNDADPRRAWQRQVDAVGLPAGLDLADPRVRLADMTGDGLQDLVLVRDGSIEYRPNLGHGRFGPAIRMRHAPRLPSRYDPRRILLGDVDGDGAADLVYVDHGQVLVWGNQSGNGWTPQPVVVRGTPSAVATDDVRLCDLYGTGMGGLLWSGARLRFLDLTGGRKPYLLSTMDNNRGAVTTVHYRPSIEDFLRDEARPATRWRTTLPFPVHVVAKVEVVDQLSRGRLTTEYRYHHGYWDGVEREFRGFAMVEQLDSERFEGSGPEHSPPTLTKSWFHVGPVAAVEADDWVELDLRHEYWSGDAPMLTRQPELDAMLADLPRAARRDALRAMRGQQLRSELYAVDGTDRTDRPYTVTESLAGVREEAPRVYFPFVLAQRTTQWERGDDPMTQFTFSAGHDAYGQPTQEIAVAVPRGRDPVLAAPAADQPYLATVTTTEYAYRDDAQRYLVDRVCRTTTFEVVNDGRLSVWGLRDAVLAGSAELRVIGHARTFYDGAAYVGLPLGEVGDHGLPVRTESLAFTDDFLAGLGTAPSYLDPSGSIGWPAEYPAEFRAAVPTLAGYVHYGDDAVPGSPGGYYLPGPGHRYSERGLVLVTRDPIGAESRVEYDEHDLLPVRTIDAVGLDTRAVYDLRLLEPREVTDINGNTTSVTFSPSSLVLAQFVRGKEGEGDVTAPSTRLEYDMLAFAERGQPVSVQTIRRLFHETQTDVPPDERVETAVSVEYSDGFGRLLQTRTQAAGTPDSVVVSGWQVYDNKGRVVAKYEPFFATGWDFAEPGEAELGQRTTIQYDPRGHAVRTVNPDGSEQRIVAGVPVDLADPDVFAPSAWEMYTYDANDNAGRTHGTAAQAYQHHWNTPASAEFDALGRAVRTVNRNGPDPVEDWFVTATTYDIQGNLVGITDALGRPAFSYRFDLAGRRWRMDSIDAGRRDAVLDALGNTVEARDAKGSLILAAFDRLNRPVRLWARDDDSAPVTLRQRMEYGDAGDPDQPPADRAAARAGNLLGRAVAHYDEAGLVTVAAADFKGNVVDSTRRVIADAPILATYDAAENNGWQVAPFTVDWQAAGDPLDPAEYRTTARFDALDRVIHQVLPRDVEGRRRELHPRYDRAGRLDRVRLDDTVYVDRITYDAKGQRTLVTYGNGVQTRYTYDPQTFRLTRLLSERAGQVLQDVGYDYDLTGNVLTIRDRTPECGLPLTPDALDRQFGYDPSYRLLTATGRESDLPPVSPPWTDLPRGTDPTKTRAYTETYRYDTVSNLLQLVHASTNGYTRDFTVAVGSNRLQRMTEGTAPYDYSFDVNGNLLVEAGTRHFDWDHYDRLVAFATQTAGAEPSVHAQYLYDADGQRVKKLVRRQGGAIEVVHYIGGVFEHHMWSTGSNNHVHVMDDEQRVSVVRLGPAHPDDGGPAVAFHLADHLGSSTAIVDGAGALTNREEYTPYGETSFGSYTRKRYRFTGRERDEESGLSHHGVRYAMVWLGRWSACDPIGAGGGLNQYLYAAANPMGLRDPSGAKPQKPAKGTSGEKEKKNNTATPQVGLSIAFRNPKGFTLAVSNNYDRAKIRAYRQRIQNPTDRGVGIRSRVPGMRTTTQDIRAANQGLRDTYEQSLRGGHRPRGTDIDHTVELQHIIRRRDGVYAPGADTVRPQDHRVQDSGLNSSQGSAASHVRRAQERAGAPIDTPAGGVARQRDLGKFTNSQGYRTGMRYFGLYTAVGGTGAALLGVRESIREGDVAGVALNTSAYLGGSLGLGGLAASSSTLLTASKVLGAPAAIVGAGAVGVQIGNNLRENYVDQEFCHEVGDWVRDKTGSAVLGATAASATAVGNAIIRAPEAAVDYAKKTWTLNPSEIDWHRTFTPWNW